MENGNKVTMIFDYSRSNTTIRFARLEFNSPRSSALLHSSDCPFISKHELYQALNELEFHFQELALKRLERPSVCVCARALVSLWQCTVWIQLQYSPTPILLRNFTTMFTCSSQLSDTWPVIRLAKNYEPN
jgi:hypothetical protein